LEGGDWNHKTLIGVLKILKSNLIVKLYSRLAKKESDSSLLSLPLNPPQKLKDFKLTQECANLWYFSKYNVLLQQL